MNYSGCSLARGRLHGVSLVTQSITEEAQSIAEFCSLARGRLHRVLRRRQGVPQSFARWLAVSFKEYYGGGREYHGVCNKYLSKS
jgi:hypothetical protein